jgi:SAM-dependent methyltransferase
MAFVPLYDNAYRGDAQEVYRQIRAETYDLDLGQTGWMTAAELRGFLPLLNLTPQSHVLEVGCGAGGCARYLSTLTNARVTGIDVNANAIDEARSTAASVPGTRLSFLHVDAREKLPFDDNSLDAVFSNDAMCHIPDRAATLAEWRRVLKPGGRILYTDAMVVTGPLTSEQLLARSSIGIYVFLPPGENERLIRAAGFEMQSAADLTANAAAIARRWHDARMRWHRDLVLIEGQSTFENLQKFLACVHHVSAKRLLSRFMYAAR